MQTWMAETMAAILGYEQVYNRPPTVRDLMPLLGLASTSAVQYRLDVLARTGMVKREPRLARAIRVVEVYE